MSGNKVIIYQVENSNNIKLMLKRLQEQNRQLGDATNEPKYSCILPCGRHAGLMLSRLNLYVCFINTYPLDSDLYLSPVVQRVDNAIHRINQYPVNSVVCFIDTYSLYMYPLVIYPVDSVIHLLNNWALVDSIIQITIQWLPLYVLSTLIHWIVITQWIALSTLWTTKVSKLKEN